MFRKSIWSWADTFIGSLYERGKSTHWQVVPKDPDLATLSFKTKEECREYKRFLRKSSRAVASDIVRTRFDGEYILDSEVVY